MTPNRDTALAYLADGGRVPVCRQWVQESPVALEYNGLAYAVMMATPDDLDDFATGFALSEGLASTPADITSLAVAEVPKGWIVRANLAGLGTAKLTERVRNRVAESSCGLCGIENLDAVARPLPQVARHAAITPQAIFAALAALGPLQALGNATRAAHAAALASPEGRILTLREDVGRHNALDKLIGARARAASPSLLSSGLLSPGLISPGFVLSTARCSYEIVEKAVRAGATTLVTISLPTTLAATRAAACGLSLWCLARDDSVLLVHDGSGAQG